MHFQGVSGLTSGSDADVAGRRSVFTAVTAAERVIHQGTMGVFEKLHEWPRFLVTTSVVLRIRIQQRQSKVPDSNMLSNDMQCI